MIRTLLLFCAAALLLTACTIEEKTSFNNDFSGKSVTKVDMSAMISFMSSMDSTGAGKSKMYKGIQDGMDSVANSQSNGFKLEMSFDTVANVISVGYSFKSLDEANEIAKKMAEKNQAAGGTTPKSFYRWVKKDKVLLMPGLEDFSSALNTQGGTSNPMLKGMTISITRSFPKKIAKVSDSRFVLSEGNKTLSFKATIEELAQNPVKDITVTFN